MQNTTRIEKLESRLLSGKDNDPVMIQIVDPGTAEIRLIILPGKIGGRPGKTLFRYENESNDEFEARAMREKALK